MHSQTYTLPGEVSFYQSSITLTSQSLNFIHWMVFKLFFYRVTVQSKNYQKCTQMAILQILRFSQQVKATSLDYFPNTHPIKGLWKIVFFGKQFWSVFNHLVNTKFYWGGGVLTLERSKVEFRFLKIISDLLFFGKTEILTIERSL